MAGWAPGKAFVQLIRPVCCLLFAGGIGAGITWFLLNRTEEEVEPEILPDTPEPTQAPLPPLYAILFSVLLTGVDVSALELQAVRTSWVEGVRADLSLPDSAGVAIVQVREDERRGDLGWGVSSAGGEGDQDGASVIRGRGKSRGEAPGGRRAGIMVRVTTRVEMLMTDENAELAAAAAQSLVDATEGGPDDPAAALPTVLQLLAQQGLANVTIAGVVDVGLWADTDKQIVTTPAMMTTPGPNFTDCGQYTLVANGTGVPSITGSVRVDQTVIIECNTMAGYRPSVSGFPSLTCLSTGLFSRGASPLLFAALSLPPSLTLDQNEESGSCMTRAGH